MLRKPPPVSVVSLLPSATDCLGWLLLQSRTSPPTNEVVLVGRSHECDWPRELVTGVPVLTRPRIDSTLSAKEIDEQVKAARGSSLYYLDEEMLDKLSPKVILTQSLCEVCSVALSQVQDVASRMTCRPGVVSLNPKTLADVLDDLIIVGNAIGLEEEGKVARQELQARVNAVVARAATNSNSTSRKIKNVFAMEWTDPVFVSGHWTPELISLAGGKQHLNPNVGYKSFAVMDDALTQDDPDLIMVAVCGMDLARTRQLIQEIQSHPQRGPWWRNLRAVQQGNVVLCDGNVHFNRPGPRLVEALEWLGWLLQDDEGNIPLRQRKYDGEFPWEVLQM